LKFKKGICLLQDTTRSDKNDTPGGHPNLPPTFTQPPSWDSVYRKIFLTPLRSSPLIRHGKKEETKKAKTFQTSILIPLEPGMGLCYNPRQSRPHLPFCRHKSWRSTRQGYLRRRYFLRECNCGQTDHWLRLKKIDHPLEHHPTTKGRGDCNLHPVIDRERRARRYSS
jgi:hypothetical protein